MSWAREYCRCCYAAEYLTPLCGTALEVYTSFCTTPVMGDEFNQIGSCFRCYEFLKEMHRFRIKCRTIDEILRNNQRVEPSEVELMLRNAMDQSSPQQRIKTELIDEYDEIDPIDIKINNVEVDYSPKSFHQSSETFPESPLVSDSDNQAHDSVNTESNLLIESYYVKVCQKTNSAGTFLQCANCKFKCKKKCRMIAHQISHSKKSVKRCDKTKQTFKMEIDSEHTSVGKKSTERLKERKQKSKLFGSKSTLSIECVKPLKCGKCSFKTTTVLDLKHHNKRMHSDEKPFKCEQCDYRAALKKDLVFHKMIHLYDKPFKSNEYSYVMPGFVGLKSHVDSKIDEKLSNDSCVESDSSIVNSGPLPTNEGTGNLDSTVSTPDKYNRLNCKMKRNRGEQYYTKTGKIVPAKIFQNKDCGCGKACMKRVSEESRLALFNLFWEMGDFEKQNAFLCASTYRNEIKQRRQRNYKGKPRESSYGYFILLKDESVEVCKEFFKETFNISPGRLYRALNAKELGKDLRGKMEGSRRKTDELLVEAVRVHIRSFPQYGNPYTCCYDPDRKYLSSELNLRKMYNMYADKCREMSITFLSEQMYRKVFREDFYLSFHNPRKNTCPNCDFLNMKVKSKKKKSPISAGTVTGLECGGVANETNLVRREPE